MSKLSDLELGWLIGILEGEGCFDYQHCKSARIRIAMTDEDTVLRVASLFNKLTGRHHEVKCYQPQSKKEPERRAQWQQAYATMACGKDAEKIMRLIVRYMSARRRQRIWQVLNGYKAKPQKIDIEAMVEASLERNLHGRSLLN